MQLLMESSEEGEEKGLAFVKGKALSFKNRIDSKLKIPHMGWNQVHQHPHPLWANIPQDSRVYFVHSYFVQPDDADVTAATTDYPAPFTCALARKNLFAVQFHPEKSQTAGLQLLKNFLQWDGSV